MRFLLVRLSSVSTFIPSKGMLCFTLVLSALLSNISQAQIAQMGPPSSGPLSPSSLSSGLSSSGQAPVMDAPYPSDHDAQEQDCSPGASPCTRSRFRPNSRRRCPQPAINCGEGQVPAPGGKRCISVV